MSHTELLCRSEYVAMRDGTRLAVSTWLANDKESDKEKNTDKHSAVLVTTRYWRAMAFKQDDPEFQPYYPYASYLWARGYVFVVADARGSGASFGTRGGELGSAEVEDIGEIIDWVAEQDWCDGRVATIGTSYTASTTVCSLASASSALKLGVCRAPDFDAYRHLFAPGGVINISFVEVWGAATAAQDANDAKALLEGGYWKVPDVGIENVLGVRPVEDDRDGALLTAAVAEHKTNFNCTSMGDKLAFIDTALLLDSQSDSCSASDSALSKQDAQTDSTAVVNFSPYLCYQDKIEQGNIPLVIRCGWHDAGTQLGALSLFNTCSNPMRVILGPWNHIGDSRVDPFQPGDGTQSEAIPIDYRLGLIANSLDATFKKVPHLLSDIPTDDQFGIVEYYTLGENQWKNTRAWPLPETKVQRLYLSEGHQLRRAVPEQKIACDIYQVDPSTSTGLNNRWYCQLEHPVFFDDRQEEDKKLLVYDTPPLEDDVEITGHPVVRLFVRSDACDGQFFVYLETVDPDGRVRLLTEGQLRALHRKVSDKTPPFKMFGPYHSLKQKDAQPLIPGEVAEIAFDLFPISVLLKKGQGIRLAIAGADKDTFAPTAGCEKPEITVERNSVYASYIDLPII